VKTGEWVQNQRDKGKWGECSASGRGGEQEHEDRGKLSHRLIRREVHKHVEKEKKSAGMGVVGDAGQGGSKKSKQIVNRPQ